MKGGKRITLRPSTLCRYKSRENKPSVIVPNRHPCRSIRLTTQEFVNPIDDVKREANSPRHSRYIQFIHSLKLVVSSEPLWSAERRRMDYRVSKAAVLSYIQNR